MDTDFGLLLYFSCLKKCLAPRRHSINTFGMKKKKERKKRNKLLLVYFAIKKFLT